MLEPHQIEELIFVASSLNRPELTERLLDFHCDFPLDFTEHFLDTLPLDRLRHIFVAVCLQSRRLPVEEIAASAA